MTYSNGYPVFFLLNKGTSRKSYRKQLRTIRRIDLEIRAKFEKRYASVDCK